jgi:hypothetical protein
MKSSLIVIGLLGCILLSVPADGLLLQQYRERKARGGVDAGHMHIYLTGVANGFVWMNAELASKKRPQFFCPPEDRDIDLEDYVRQIDEVLTWHPWSADTSIEPLLLRVIQRRFPCRK